MENKPGKNAQNLKAENRGMLFRHLATSRRTSRAELTKISGLTKMTLSNIIGEFLAQHYVTETADSASRATRSNPIMLELSPDAPKIIGLLIRRTHIAVALCNFNLDMLYMESEKLTTYNQDSMLETAFRLVSHLMQFGNILGIGIGSIGPVDIHKGVILNPPNFSSIHDVPIVEIFKKAYHLPVFLDYHYNCTALAEKYYGNGKKYHDYLSVGISDGLSLGIVTHDQLYSSSTGFASELGHLCVNFDDESDCTCGNHGCLGTYTIFDDVDDVQLKKSIHVLGTALAGLCNTLNPQAIIVNDANNILSDVYLALLEEEVNKNLVIRDYRHIDVLKSYRSDNLETASCAISVIHQVFQGKLMF